MTSGSLFAACLMMHGAAAFGQEVAKGVALADQVPDVVARSKDLGPSDPARVLHLAVSMPYADPAGMAAFVDGVSDPASKTYRQFITPEEVGARFGLSDKQVQGVVDHLTANGFKIVLVAKNHLNILADCTVAQAEKAFGISIHEFQALRDDEPGNTRYFANTTDPTLPAGIAASVIYIEGLESFTKPQPRILNPTQTRTLYSLAPMYSGGTRGQGRTIGISSFDGYRLTNVPLYYNQYGLAAPPGGAGTNITVVTVGGGSGTGTPSGEGDLDIQMPLGVAPLCTMRVYDGGALTSVLTQEANDNLADVISESYGWNLSTSAGSSAHNVHLSMSAQGITYMAASGDNGTTLEPYSYPNSDPDVLSVGGTVASVNGAGTRTSEVGWAGSGGGWGTKTYSFNVLPSWQHGTGVPTGTNKRLVPDVALSASGSSGAYYFFANGSLQGGSVGTSFASPVFAGSLAVAEQQIIAQGGLAPNAAGKQRFGRLQDLIYSQNGRSDVWYDITSGSNGSLPSGGGTSSAGVGWDSVTGWGAINFSAFVASVGSGCVAPTVTANPSSVVVCSGATTSFGATADGYPVNYHWLLGTTQLSDGPTATGAVISGSTTHSMTITGVQTGDAGSYTCVVSNACGQDQTTSATLTVNAGPVISQQPVGLTVCAQGMAALALGVSAANPAPSFQWQWVPPHSAGTPINVVEGLNSDPGSGLPAFTAQGSQTASLSCGGFASPYRVGQSMAFTCTVTNSCATQTSSPATVNICLADFNCSGSVTTQDIFDYLNAWFASGQGSDFDASGAATVQDIFEFLTAWFSGC
jgi:subtilase family serine protease